MPAAIIDSLLAADPATVLVGGTAAALLLVLLDFESGFSMNLPGRRRLGLAGVIFIGSGFIYYFNKFGVEGLLDTIAGDIITGTLVTVLFAVILRERGMI